MRGIKEKRKQNRLKERVPVCINREKVFLKIENIFQIRINRSSHEYRLSEGVFYFAKLHQGMKE